MINLKKDGCPYCQEGEYLAKFGVKAFETETSLVIVFKDQAYKGRCIVAYKKSHVAEICDLDEKERIAFLNDVSDVAKAIHKAYNPDRVDYGAFGDTLGHLHFHLVPKYVGKEDWGGMFKMNHGAESYASDAEINEVINNIKNNFRK